jgi:hypothetical protein
MGLLQEVAAHPLAQQFQTSSLSYQVAIVVAAFFGLSVAYHVASQLLFKSPNEPPMVFSWFPIIGSTITYGMDPPRFFKENREKVGLRSRPSSQTKANSDCVGSSVTSSPSFSSARRPLSRLVPPETTSFSTASSKTSTLRKSTLPSPPPSSAATSSTIAPTRSSWSRRRYFLALHRRLTPLVMRWRLTCFTQQ